MSKPKTAGYSHTYRIGLDQFEKIWYEVELEPGDDVRQELYKCKKQVTDFHFESNKAAEKKEQEAKEEPKTQEARIIAQIYGASDLKVLDTFKLLAKNNELIEAAYNHRLKELLNV